MISPNPSRTLRSFTRRQFLSQSAGLAAGIAVGRGLAPSAGLAADTAVQPGRAKLSACIEAVFTRGPFEQRLEQVRAAGLTVFEFWGWRNRDLEALARKKEETGLELAAFSSETGGALVAPGSSQKFIPALKDSIATAKKLGCKRLIATVGNERKDISRSEQHKNIVEALKAGAPLCEEAEITLVLEPLNVLVNHKGYYLATSAEGFEILDQVGSPNVKLLFDIYHQQITEGNLIQNITQNIGKIGHFHVADVPGRHEPGTGEINYANVFKSIKQSGYSGFLGLEMWPTIDHTAAVKHTLELFNQG
jgi:hydroxypyruvate isomerase